MIYLDTSVALAHLLAEDRHPPAALWRETIVASRLLEYELWTRIHARALGRSHGDTVRALLSRIAFVEMSPAVLERVTEPFSGAIRTLDALHLASADFLRRQGQAIEIASYDQRMRVAARKLDFVLSSFAD